MNVFNNTIRIYNYLTLKNVGKSGNVWVINVTNPSSSSITVYYNTKMCNEGDSRNWSGLKNITSITIGAYQSSNVAIGTNFFATHIAISYISGGKRLILYANGLNNSGGINVLNNNI